MAKINYNITSVWNNDTFNFAGKHYEGKLRLDAVQNPGKETVASESNDKHAYYTSSNGYYGYLPIMQETKHEECMMDTNDSDMIIAGVQTDEKTKNIFSMGINLGRRKRDRREDITVECTKKQRKEEFSGLSPCQVTVPPPTRSTDVHYPRCIMGHYV
ncbi:hypothetical protein L9F63_013751 [Diploptera punctata]|uniref:Uncharacterized protein n=1 Tax=Diploptera punctata TaxID=6984 RepID=A0AAD8A9D6_DIPPU|nr:hypothetical protein L9F63_013751 [Diploptera punctata]